MYVDDLKLLAKKKEERNGSINWNSLEIYRTHRNGVKHRKCVVPMMLKWILVTPNETELPNNKCIRPLTVIDSLE